jgi:hypothetical protein
MSWLAGRLGLPRSWLPASMLESPPEAPGKPLGAIIALARSCGLLSQDVSEPWPRNLQTQPVAPGPFGVQER